MSLQVLVRLVDPAELALGRVNTRRRGRTLELLLDQTQVDPEALPVLLEARDRALAEVVPLIEPGRPTPIVRYFMERNIPGGRLHLDVGPVLTDVYLEYGLMPQDMADEVAGHSTNLLRHFPL
ncbi:hypothetical protein ACBJ59_61100 [Nonomuraea sp. MTCD27]|uniref:hypothetical protein n=1 Tax=Nonomuraea sp. MTCD27 TaxID=1676747 RepID=UPI0035BFBCD6